MRRILGAIREWRRRRARLTEEWRFHQHRAACELEDLGFTRREAELVAHRRLGPRSRYQRDARRDTGADLAGLLRLVLPRPVSFSALVLPAALVLTLAATYAPNPWRGEVWQIVSDPLNFTTETDISYEQSRCRPGEAYVGLMEVPARPDPCVQQAPWVRHQGVPSGWVRGSWGILFAAGFISLTLSLRRTGRGWRLWLYGLATATLMYLAGVSLWVTGLQWMSAVTWFAVEIKGLALIAVAFLTVWCAVFARRYWRRDVERRCPECLRPLRMPVERGLAGSMLLDPAEVEMICAEGHGTLTESRWQQSFRLSPGFWEDLAGQPTVARE
jgi:hypothetical protein